MITKPSGFHWKFDKKKIRKTPSEDQEREERVPEIMLSWSQELGGVLPASSAEIRKFQRRTFL